MFSVLRGSWPAGVGVGGTGIDLGSAGPRSSAAACPQHHPIRRSRATPCTAHASCTQCRLPEPTSDGSCSCKGWFRRIRRPGAGSPLPNAQQIEDLLRRIPPRSQGDPQMTDKGAVDHCSDFLFLRRGGPGGSPPRGVPVDSHLGSTAAASEWHPNVACPPSRTPSPLPLARASQLNYLSTSLYLRFCRG